MNRPAAGLAAGPAAAGNALRALLDTYLRCPAEPVLNDLQQALRTYQTEWIRARAGADAPAPAEPAKAGVPKARFKVTGEDRAVLERLAEGWEPTTAEVRRWAWFEDRELVRLMPNPAGTGPEVLRLAPGGWHAIGRLPPEA
ncbi:hypothetical protein [Azospirillum halopraeferens]|uniref:hypothetical protein n=1 Tax=Azospirillum halopraeferens TaxID=34010 RepID=UPI000422E1FB|nr:hypothetical protein [Azospirillum halopraeferens]